MGGGRVLPDPDAAPRHRCARKGPAHPAEQRVIPGRSGHWWVCPNCNLVISPVTPDTPHGRANGPCPVKRTRGGALRICDGGCDGVTHQDRSLGVRWVIKEWRAIDVE